MTPDVQLGWSPGTPADAGWRQLAGVIIRLTKGPSVEIWLSILLCDLGSWHRASNSQLQRLHAAARESAPAIEQRLLSALQ
jgi:hypothetical protein